MKIKTTWFPMGITRVFGFTTYQCSGLKYYVNTNSNKIYLINDKCLYLVNISFTINDKLE